MRLPAQLAGIDALIIPGGESTTITRLLDIYELREPIRASGERGLPIWGTCAGAIVLAKQATDLDRPNLGLMDIDVRRNAFGRQVDSFEEDLASTASGEPPFHAVFIRAPGHRPRRRGRRGAGIASRTARSSPRAKGTCSPRRSIRS